MTKIEKMESFKPYYKWIIFNIGDQLKDLERLGIEVLNLIING